jgi:repressor LexA
MPDDLTPRQQQVLDFILAHSATEGRPPTLREIAEGLGLRQHSSAQAHVQALTRKGHLRRSSQHRDLRPGALAGSGVVALSLPLVGRVAAGVPIMADAHIDRHVAVDPALFRPRAHFLLRVEGDSMIDAGILDGDLIAVHRTADAADGQIAVVRVEDEVTVKRIRRAGRVLQLVAANPAYAPIEVDPATTAFAIEGLYVGLVRQ